MGQSILFLHGLGGSGQDWSKLIELFKEKGIRAEAPTLFEHLRTHKPPPPALSNLSYFDWLKSASDYADQLEREEGEKPIVIGHCLGGLLAQKLIEFDQAKAGVFMSPLPSADIRSSKNTSGISFLEYSLTSTNGINPLQVLSLKWAMQNTLKSAQNLTFSSRMRHESKQLFKDLKSHDEIENLTRVNARIDAPVLFVSGGMNRVVDPSCVAQAHRVWAQASPTALHKTYTALTHAPQDDAQYETMFKDIVSWVGRLETTKAKAAA